MSVFKSLKGTFQNVQQDIVVGLRALTSLDSTPRHEKIKHLRAEGVNLDAGADILYRYQNEWSELQSYTTVSAKKAEDVDGMMGEMFKRYEQQWEAACHLEEEAVALPTITSTLKDMIQLIGCLQKDFLAVEYELDKLQNICEEETLLHEKQSHASQLALYKKKKEADSLIAKGKLWQLLKERARELETRKSHSLKEREEALLDAFTSDMNYYRTHGHPDRLPGGTEFPKVSSLSDITIEEDGKALNEFLSAEDPGEEDLTHMGESFIEDDYTAAYTTTEEHLESFPELGISQTIDYTTAYTTAVEHLESSSELDPSQAIDYPAAEDHLESSPELNIGQAIDYTDYRAAEEHLESSPDLDLVQAVNTVTTDTNHTGSTEVISTVQTGDIEETKEKLSKNEAKTNISGSAVSSCEANEDCLESEECSEKREEGLSSS